MRKRIFVLVVLCLVVLPVFAANWKQIGETEYIDVSSIKPYNDPYPYEKAKYNRNEVEFWLKTLNDKSYYFTKFERYYNKKMWYKVNKTIIDCNNKTIARKSTYLYDTQGNAVLEPASSDLLLERLDIAPETKSELYYKYVCK